MSVYYHTACSYPNCKPEDIINCEAAIHDHKRYMKWHQLKQAVIILSDDDDVIPQDDSESDLFDPTNRFWEDSDQDDGIDPSDRYRDHDGDAVSPRDMLDPFE